MARRQKGYLKTVAQLKTGYKKVVNAVPRFTAKLVVIVGVLLQLENAGLRV